MSASSSTSTSTSTSSMSSSSISPPVNSAAARPRGNEGVNSLSGARSSKSAWSSSAADVRAVRPRARSRSRSLRRPRRRLRRFPSRASAREDGPPAPPGELFVGRQELGRFDVGLRFDGPVGPSVGLGWGLGAEPRSAAGGVRAGGRSRVRRPGCEAGCVREELRGSAPRPRSGSSGRSGSGSRWRSTSSIPARPAARPGRSATWPGGGGANEAGGRGRSGSGRALAAARPDRGPAAAARRRFGPRFLVRGSELLGAGGWLGSRGSIGSGNSSSRPRQGARLRGGCDRPRSRVASTAVPDRRGVRPRALSPNEGSRRVSGSGTSGASGGEPARGRVPALGFGRRGRGGRRSHSLGAAGGQVGLEWLRRPGRQPARSPRARPAVIRALGDRSRPRDGSSCRSRSILPVTLHGLGPGRQARLRETRARAAGCLRAEAGAPARVRRRPARAAPEEAGGKIFFVDQAFAEPPGHLGSVAAAADGAIRPFAIAVPVSFPAAVAILGSGRRLESQGVTDRLAARALASCGRRVRGRDPGRDRGADRAVGNRSRAGAWSRGRVGFSAYGGDGLRL